LREGERESALLGRGVAFKGKKENIVV